MINMDALDTVIAVVVVILLLSLIVQSIQSVLKKAFKIKSRQIEDSLIDLFENVLHRKSESKAAAQEGEAAAQGNKTEPKKLTWSEWFIKISGSSPVLRSIYEKIFRRMHPSNPLAYPDDSVRMLFSEVTKGLQDVGRVAQTGNRMLDSVSKEDLKKIMGKVLPDSLSVDFTRQLKNACDNIPRVIDAINTINNNEDFLGSLGGDANAKFAAMQQSLAPLLNDLNAIRKGEELSPTLIIGDISNLRDIKVEDALEILGEIQKKVEADLAEAQKPGAPAGSEAHAENLKAVSSALSSIAQALTALSNGLDAAIAPLRTKLNEVETWYDTVMQSFEERYTRGMKTWAIVISFLVVAYLNANVFDIYKNIATNDVLRNQLVQLGEQQAKAREVQSQAKEEKDQKAADQTLEDIKKDMDKIRGQITDYSSLGFQPLTWQGVKERFNPNLWRKHPLVIDGKPVVDEKGYPVQEPDADWRGWFNRRKQDIKTLFGWLVMTMLLSVGAPFWQDTLESLFGVKNLLRKRSDTKNVERESGAGQPRP